MFISRIEKSGSILVLSDGSRWEVALLDQLKAGLWLPNSAVELARVGAGQATITNTSLRQSVTATRRG